MLPIVLNPATAYATKDNIKYPGSQTKADALESTADSRAEDVLDDVSLNIDGWVITGNGE